MTSSRCRKELKIWAQSCCKFEQRKASNCESDLKYEQRKQEWILPEDDCREFIAEVAKIVVINQERERQQHKKSNPFDSRNLYEKELKQKCGIISTLEHKNWKGVEERKKNKRRRSLRNGGKKKAEKQRTEKRTKVGLRK